MLDKLKQLGQLKAMQNEVKKEMFDVERDGVKVSVRGDMTIESIEISDETSREVIAEVVKDLANQGIKDAQQSAAQKMMKMGFGQ